jgi:hypothetical protein
MYQGLNFRCPACRILAFSSFGVGGHAKRAEASGDVGVGRGRPQQRRRLHGCVQLYGGKRRKGLHITTHQLAQSEASLFLEAQYCPEGYMYNQATNQVQSYVIIRNQVAIR